MNQLELKLARVAWNDSSTIERAYFVLRAELTGEVIIFTDLDQSPKWEDIEETHQKKLAEIMARVAGA